MNRGDGKVVTEQPGASEGSQCSTRTLSRLSSLIRVPTVFHPWLKIE